MMKNSKKKIIIAACVVIVLVIIVIAKLPSGNVEQANGPVVFSKRAKITMEEPPEAAPAPRAEKSAPAPAKVKSTARSKAPAKPAIKIDITERKKIQRTAKKTKEPAKRVPADPVKTAKLARLNPWAVNVASFVKNKDAGILTKKLTKLGYNAYATEFKKDDRLWHRVRVGFYRSRDEAKKAGRDIQKKFSVQTPWIVKPTQEEVARYVK